MDGKLPFPKDAPPTFTVTLTFTLMHDFARFANGTMAMRFADTSATWKAQPEAGIPESGEVGATVGGALFFSHGDRAWKCVPAVSVPALVAAEAAQYLPKKEE